MCLAIDVYGDVYVEKTTIILRDHIYQTLEERASDQNISNEINKIFLEHFTKNKSMFGRHIKKLIPPTQDTTGIVTMKYVVDSYACIEYFNVSMQSLIDSLTFFISSAFIFSSVAQPGRSGTLAERVASSSFSIITLL